jgi:hypothetical protein
VLGAPIEEKNHFIWRCGLWNPIYSLVFAQALNAGTLFFFFFSPFLRLSRFVLMLLRIQGLGFKDPTLWPFFAGERRSGSLKQGFESLLPGKRHQKLPEISQIWATFGKNLFFAVFSVFLRVYPFGVNHNYCYGSFLWNSGIRIRKIRIGFKSFF